MLVLGIETTCDETAAAVVERQSDGSGKILSNIVRSQTLEHARFGGVVPEIAARAHVDLLDGIVGQAMKDANTGFAQLSAVAAYIENQQAHHQKTTFLEEYRKMLHDFAIDFDERYIFKEPE